MLPDQVFESLYPRGQIQVLSSCQRPRVRSPQVRIGVFEMLPIRRPFNDQQRFALIDQQWMDERSDARCEAFSINPLGARVRISEPSMRAPPSLNAMIVGECVVTAIWNLGCSENDARSLATLKTSS